MKKAHIWRGFFYVLGICFLSIGITLNTKTGLGLSPVTSVPYSISTAFSLNFSTVLCWYYIACTVLQILVKGKKSGWKEIAQVPASFLFSAVQGQFAKWMSFLTPAEAWHSWALLPFAVLFTGFGIALMVNMELVPYPADGVPVVVSQVIKKDVGLAKNFVDATLVLVTLTIDLLFSRHIVSLGAGTIVAMVGNGRAVALFDRLFQMKVKDLSGLLICANNETNLYKEES